MDTKESPHYSAEGEGRSPVVKDEVSGCNRSVHVGTRQIFISRARLLIWSLSFRHEVLLLRVVILVKIRMFPAEFGFPNRQGYGYQCWD